MRIRSERPVERHPAREGWSAAAAAALGSHLSRLAAEEIAHARRHGAVTPKDVARIGHALDAFTAHLLDRVCMSAAQSAAQGRDHQFAAAVALLFEVGPAQ